MRPGGPSIGVFNASFALILSYSAYSMHICALSEALVCMYATPIIYHET